MPLPWLAVGQLVLGNLDKIIGVVNPAFTRKKVDVSSAQFDLLNQQIAELQAAASSNAGQITQLAAQVKELVGALELAAAEAAAHRTATRRLSWLALAASLLAVGLGLSLVFLR